MQICISLRYLFTLAWLRRCKTCRHRGTKCACETRPTNALEYIFYLESKKSVSRSIVLNSMRSSEQTRDRSTTCSSTIRTDRTEAKKRSRARTCTSSRRRFNPTTEAQRHSSHRTSASYRVKSGKDDIVHTTGSHVDKPALVLFHQDERPKYRARLRSYQPHDSVFEQEDYDFNPHVTMAFHQEPTANAPRMFSSRQNRMNSFDVKRASSRSNQLTMLTHSQLDSSLAASAGTILLSSPTDLGGSRARHIGGTSQQRGGSNGDSTTLLLLKGWLSQSPTSSNNSSLLYAYNV
ncbi:unnamed protein product [Albugo candida]|uniref:Uncharacterized protein n=1 Tax=Albugo candida TaxID=65357 RepID=A0A024G076_9STRA|nr:unnamed protein product [Albugo candida]|eukprot:CCI40252.1 unnamed protein product [Albugo candida]